MRTFLIPGALAIAGAMSAPAVGATTTEPGDLSGLSIEELANIEVRSASKHEEPLSAAPAALYVITGEEIESSGAISLPEALRLAPNLQVQQVDASQYAISARGFNGLQASNKLLVLIDGRSIYTPLASSVYYNLQAPLLEDIQQIEVISGPGGTLYGPNAVNGVVNITSRDAQDTIGTLIRGSAGEQARTAAVRHGFALGGSGAMRVYANYLDREGLPKGTGAAIDDSARIWQAGFRSDFTSDSDHVTVQGDIFHSDDDAVEGDRASGHNVLARWSRALNANSSFQLQTYYDWFERDFTFVHDELQTIDSEGQFNLTSGPHQLVAGAGARTTKDEFNSGLGGFVLDPASRRLWVYNAFVQDRLALTNALSLTAGIKVEKSSFVGWQLLPSVRLAWQPNDHTLLWTAVSRAARTPSRIDRELVFLPILAKSDHFTSEKLTAIEAGYRGQPTPDTSVSINGFVNLYDDIRTTEYTGDPLPIRLLNGIEGRSYGIEAWGSAQILPWWRVSAGLATIWKDFHIADGRVDLQPRNSLGNDPTYKITVGTDVQIAPKVQLTVNARALDGIETDPVIRSYVDAGARLSYQATDQIELYLAGRNVIHETHAESNDPGAAQLAKRGVDAGVRLRF